KENLFPRDSSLLRPEDGVALADGRVIVADQAKGLRIIEKSGANRPFGNFSEVGFVHNPPASIAGPNGLFLEHDKQHLLMCDYFTGKIYRIKISSEKVVLVYDHPFGVNAIYRDKTGAIWFTQSDNNTNVNESSINSTIPGGAIFRMADIKSVPTTIADSLHLANGITMDRDEKTLFVAESLMNRVLSFDVDITNGKTSNHGVAGVVVGPDNILIDSKGRLIIASPITSQVIAVDFKNHAQYIIFDASTTETRKLADEWFRRSQSGIPRLSLFTRKLYGPLPGLLTGMFFSPDGRTLYVATLGKAILKLDLK
ncbi:MAG TPA: SMP-30/gluconolactonase/LRE family protein, partial [Flavitalea sp.]|nr:SMP-30/gluconolactonase/LRE family protein [Flavitalea sp.]